MLALLGSVGEGRHSLGGRDVIMLLVRSAELAG